MIPGKIIVDPLVFLITCALRLLNPAVFLVAGSIKATLLEHGVRTFI